MGDLLDRRALFAVGRRSIVTSSGLRINPKVVDTEGSDVNIALGAMAIMGEEISGAMAACMRGLFVETALDDALDRVAFDRYQLTRQPASPATVTLFLIRPTAAFGAFTYPAGSRAQTPAGTQFATDADVVFSVSDLQKTVNATALVAGVGGNVPLNTIRQFVEQPADSTLTVSNLLGEVNGVVVPGGAAGGVDAETDSEFRARILDFFPTVRRGTIGAIEFGARQVPGVAVARAIEIETVSSGSLLPSCSVLLVIADRNGGFSVTMLQAVKDIMLQYRAAGIPVTVSGGIISQATVQWRLAFETGVDQTRVREEVRAVTVAVGQFLRPGETLYRSALIAGARAVPGTIVDNSALVLPVGDTVPTDGGGVLDNTKLIRIASTDVTFV